MGYKIVAVNPLKPFPLPSFRLANIKSIDDANSQIEKWFKDAKKQGVEAERVRHGIAGLAFGSEEATKIEIFWDSGCSERIAALEARWAEGKIEPALKIHLARQEKRLAHFKVSCRFADCDNPHRQKRGGGTGTKARRPAVRPLFCGAHVGLRKLLTQGALDALHASSERRVVIA